jgi:hypothetical protein
MKFSGAQKLLAVVVLLSYGGVLFAAGPSSRVEQRLHEEVQSVLMRLIQSGELSAEQAEALSLQAPAGRQAAFGAYFDVRHREGAENQGVVVLGVASGSSAASIGLRPGDRLIAIDGTSLVGFESDSEGRSLALAPLREHLLEDADSVELRVVRDGVEQTLSGPVQVVELPAYRLSLGSALAQATLAAEDSSGSSSSCGRISTFDIAPRTQQLYAAVLIAIDGKLPGPRDLDNRRVSPGRHVLRVAEAIDPRRFGDIARFQRSRPYRDRYKEIEVDVQPGITYRLAARFLPEHRHSIRDGAYWEPVIWKETPESCG